jgi:hypothetical protein
LVTAEILFKKFRAMSLLTPQIMTKCRQKKVTQQDKVK